MCHRFFKSGVVLDYLRAAVIAVLVSDFLQFVSNDLEQSLFAFQYTLQLADEFVDLLKFVAQFQNLKPGQTLQPQIQNGLCLDVGKGKAFHQARLGFLAIFGSADEGQHFIQIIYRNNQTLQDVRTRKGLIQVKLCSFGHHIFLMVDIVLQHGLKTNLARLAIRDSHHVNAKRDLHIGVLV